MNLNFSRILSAIVMLVVFPVTITAAPFIAGLPYLPAPQQGELLLTELNCLACHEAGESVRTRLSPRLAPRLGKDGLQLTPQFLRAFLAAPHVEKPGTPMPDLLHALPPQEKAAQIDALVHFLVSESRTNTPVPTGADTFKIELGRLLYHQVGCVACHAPQEPASILPTSHASAETPVPDFHALTNTSVAFGNLSRKLTVDELARFLRDPLKFRASGRMPSLNLTAAEATHIAMYLLRGQAERADGQRAKVKGLSFQFYEGGFSSTLDLDKAQPKESGLIDRFELKFEPGRRPDNTGFRFTGFITVPADGTYTFYSASDDGSRLFIGAREVVTNDGTHGTEEKKGSIELKAGEHPIMVTWFNGGGEATLRVSWEGPGFRKQTIPTGVLSTDSGQPMLPSDAENFTPDPGKARRGNELFSSLGCAACHEVSGRKLPSTLVAKPWNALQADSAEGCLNAPAGAHAADYELTDAQRIALREALAARDQFTQPRTPRDEVVHRMAALNCFACHARNIIGGPSEARAPYFTVLGEADLGDEGRIPPHLTQVGDKLRPAWLREVLLNKGAARPYMATRMPQFGEAQAGPLAEFFLRADDTHVEDAEVSAADVKWGRRLVGTGGFACISCHTFAGNKSLGIPAMDLTAMTRRLRENWFHQYLLDPPALRPGTRMPAFWPEGRSTQPEILGGDTDRQIHAIWAYLQRGKEAGLPPGLIQGKMEIVADHEAVIYRHWISGAGSRAIGVAYPEKANLAFDAAKVRLALLWQGPFIDAARHRTGRGDGSQGPLGYNVITLPPGPMIAVLPDDNAPWPRESDGFKFLGYNLDEQQRPTFRYTFQGLEIHDFPKAIPGEVDANFRRTISLQGANAPSGLWFRAWVGNQIESRGDSFVADNKVTLRFGDGVKAIVRQSGGKAELLVPVHFTQGAATIVEEILW